MLMVHLVAYLLQMGMLAILYGLGRDLWDTLLWGAWGVSIRLIVYAFRTAPPRQMPPIDWRILAGLTLVALLPVLIFKPSPFYFLNSRYSYLASAFAAIGVGALLTQRLQRSRVATWGSACYS